jgi:hypothetical protein
MAKAVPRTKRARPNPRRTAFKKLLAFPCIYYLYLLS